MNKALHCLRRLGHKTVITVLLSSITMLSPIAWGSSDDDIAKRLSGLIATPPKCAIMAVYVERVDTGAPVFDYRGDEPMIPASNQKILTTSAAMHYLGPNFQYTTELRCRGEIRGNTLFGDLIVVGSGDPTISGQYAQYSADTTSLFHDWAQQVKKLGITHVTGYVIGDDGVFDNKENANGWPMSGNISPYCAGVSALTFPRELYMKIAKGVRTFAASSTSHLRRGSKKSSAKNSTPKPTPAIVPTANRGCTTYFVSAMREIFIKNGIQIDHEGRDIDDCVSKDVYKSNTRLLATHKSLPLHEIIAQTNTHSVNLFAEMILKTIGSHTEKVGSFESGTRAVTSYLSRNKVSLQNVHLVDGSGLSRENRVTAKVLVGALRLVDASPYRDAYRDTFPVGGKDGTLRRRFAASTKQRQDGERICAKTGYIRNVRALSGWATQPDGTEYRFSIIVNGTSGAFGGGIEWVDKVGLALVQSDQDFARTTATKPVTQSSAIKPVSKTTKSKKTTSVSRKARKTRSRTR